LCAGTWTMTDSALPSHPSGDRRSSSHTDLAIRPVLISSRPAEAHFAVVIRKSNDFKSREAQSTSPTMRRPGSFHQSAPVRVTNVFGSGQHDCRAVLKAKRECVGKRDTSIKTCNLGSDDGRAADIRRVAICRCCAGAVCRKMAIYRLDSRGVSFLSRGQPRTLYLVLVSQKKHKGDGPSSRSRRLSTPLPCPGRRPTMRSFNRFYESLSLRSRLG
jgi:hypothetical protein